MKEQHCCPWWMNYLIGNPLRLLMQQPNKLFGHLVEPGMSVLDAGCGMGVFTIALAEMAGADGQVVAVVVIAAVDVPLAGLAAIKPVVGLQ